MTEALEKLQRGGLSYDCVEVICEELPDMDQDQIRNLLSRVISGQTSRETKFSLNHDGSNLFALGAQRMSKYIDAGLQIVIECHPQKNTRMRDQITGPA